MPNGKELTVEAPNNNQRNVYVQWVEVNDQAHSAADISHQSLAEGGTLSFTMTDQPVDRPHAKKDMPFSLSTE